MKEIITKLAKEIIASDDLFLWRAFTQKGSGPGHYEYQKSKKKPAGSAWEGPLRGPQKELNALYNSYLRKKKEKGWE